MRLLPCGLQAKIAPGPLNLWIRPWNPYANVSILASLSDSIFTIGFLRAQVSSIRMTAPDTSAGHRQIETSPLIGTRNGPPAETHASRPPQAAARPGQSFRCRNAATPAMNICTDSAISSMPITRSSAVSTLSPSQRNR